MPAITPQIIPAKGGAPLATAIPKQRGKATKNTTIPDSRSDFKYFVVSFILLAKFFKEIIYERVSQDLILANSFFVSVTHLKNRHGRLLYAPASRDVYPATFLL